MSDRFLHDSRDYSFADAAMAAMQAEIRRLQRWKADGIAYVWLWDNNRKRATAIQLRQIEYKDLDW